MDSSTVILLSMLGFLALVKAVWALSHTKPLRKYEEYRIVVVGAATFMYTSWLVIYMANINPFVEPVFKKHKVA